MKKFLIYSAVCVALATTGCVDFGTESQLTLPNAPATEITNVVAESDTAIHFTVKPASAAGFYSWMVVESDEADVTIQADRVLKLTAEGLAKGIANYAASPDTIVSVGELKPYTVYQIYAVTSTTDGVVGAIKNTSIRTLDDGGRPSPTKVEIADSTVTLSFSEPVRFGTGKVYVSYFAKNTVSGNKPLVVTAGFENFNPQDIEIEEDRLSIDGSDLIIKLPAPPAGVYASITYDNGAVLDLEGNAANAYTNKADTLINQAPSRGITVRLATKTWALHSEFEDIAPDTLCAFSVWDELIIPALPDSAITFGRKISAKIPTVTYYEPTKFTTINVTNWGLSQQGIPEFLLPEEPAFGATLDLSIPKGSFEDVYGNENEALVIDNNYIYSYGYTDADIIGTYNLAVMSYFDGLLSETGITIEKDTESSAFLVKNLFLPGTIIKAEFDPVMGTLVFDDDQLLRKDLDVAGGKHDLYFVNANVMAPVVFNVPAPGKITSDDDNWWGYYFPSLNPGWWDVYVSSVWTRTSTEVSTMATMNAVTKDQSNISPRPGPFRR